MTDGSRKPSPTTREIDRFEHWLGWLADPTEMMQRASHAVTRGEDLWLIDPVDTDDLDERLAGRGDVRGVVLLLDRHRRDCATVANRYDVSVWIPSWFDGVGDSIDAPIATFTHELADTGIQTQSVMSTSIWQEALLWAPSDGVLVVPEAVGTARYFLAGDDRLGVHPMVRLFPPTMLRRFEPEHILVGHGAGVHTDATAALNAAIKTSRSRTPRLFVETLRSFSPL